MRKSMKRSTLSWNFARSKFYVIVGVTVAAAVSSRAMDKKGGPRGLATAAMACLLLAPIGESWSRDAFPNARQRGEQPNRSFFAWFNLPRQLRQKHIPHMQLFPWPRHLGLHGVDQIG